VRLVFFLGGGFLEVSGQSTNPPGDVLAVWIQVRHVGAELQRLLAVGVSGVREPQLEPWGLVEMWIKDPDGVRIVLVEVPPTTRSAVTNGDRSQKRARRLPA
jgi:hypothetical protein